MDVPDDVPEGTRSRGPTVHHPLAQLPPGEQRLLSPAPDGLELVAAPMLARLSDRREFPVEWIFERKWDGVRVLAVRHGDRVWLRSRSGQPLNDTYPELVEALARQPHHDLVVDGEVVAFHRGRTDFSLLQQRMQITDPERARASPVRISYQLFDLLALDGLATGRLPLRTRKSLLRRVVEFTPPLGFTPHRNQGGADLLERACAQGWEGLIAKRARSRYGRGRSGDWLKLKCSRGQEFVIGGYTDPSGARIGFGALLLGYYQAGSLRYAGKVGTGFDDATLRVLHRGLEARARASSPFTDPVRERGPHWVEPLLVAQVDFAEWTRDGMLRHPRFLGLRGDKDPREVVREGPAPRTG
ncbi:non-homologous end-joining DNA ligase [Streptomyces sp. NPDC005438]|uniref:non-homologous end-joining DNA ligase n=1 Tax=Streptomyces sp. NPDC005438 TaxID=3156880 RepID=UPI0033BF2BAE